MNLIAAEGGSYRHGSDPGEPTTGKPRLSVTDDEAAILSVWARNETVLEIGTGLGVSTRMLAKYAAHVTTVDIDPWVQETIWPTLPDNVTGAPSTTDLLVGVFGMAFIDGDHSTAATRADIDTATRLVGPGGLIVVHDVNYGNVRKALTEDDWQFLNTHHGLGFRLVP